jgi:peptide/nickel transport system substrate-binding protein
MSLITEEAPACFMWRHKLLWGISEKVDYQPAPDAGIFGLHIKVRR